MRFIPHILVGVLCASASGGGVYYFTQPVAQPEEVQAREVWEVRYSPKGGCTEHIVSEIDKATDHIKVWAYSFTSKPIAEALIRAKKRGVDVGVVIDAPSVDARGGLAVYLSLAGIPVWADKAHAIQHQKVMAIDGTLLFGSFNWSANAETRNSEVLVTLRNCKPEMYSKFLDNWYHHQGHSELLHVR